jgi:putative transposase
MARHAGFSRWVYNWGLRLWSEGYKEGMKPSANTLKKLFTNHVKPQFAWMSELSSKVYQYVFINLGDAPYWRYIGEQEAIACDRQ